MNAEHRPNIGHRFEGNVNAPGGGVGDPRGRSRTDRPATTDAWVRNRVRADQEASAAVPCAAAHACRERHTDGTGRTRATAAVSGRRQVVNPGVHGPRPGVQSTSSMSSTPPLTDRGGRRPDQVQASHRRNGSLAPAGTAGRASNQTQRLGWTRSVRDGEDPSVAVPPPNS